MQLLRLKRTKVCAPCSFFLLALVQALVPTAFARSIPRPLPSHPGNIFVATEAVQIKLPSGSSNTWRLVDYEGKTVREGRAEQGAAALGKLPVGYYELATGAPDAASRVSLGVIEPLHAPTPLDSPIGIDVAMAWFFPKEKMGEVANLCTLAGMNRVRDRLMWQELEPKRGEFVGENKYDQSAEAQLKAGLQILQVSHVSAAWANPDVMHFPPDLRDIYNFNREMARRWQGKVCAFEPWNEADIKEFGGHTGSEMASLQKAAYFGLKAGNSNVIACLNVFAIRRAATLSDFNNNEAWPYFDTFNLHHYEPLKNYPSLYADFRAVSGGKPLWVSECSVKIKWQGDERLHELTDEDARLQAERLTKTYALSLHQGAVAIFYFMLPHYTEGVLQYGILRADLTPRPAFVAAAAVGRLLAGAKPAGRIDLGNKTGQAYCFDAEPDGRPAKVLVAWGPTETDFELPAEPKACFDFLGRPLPVSERRVKVGSAPIFAILDKSAPLHLVPPPKPAKLLEGRPTRLVLQALLPKADIVLDKSAYRVPAAGPKNIPIFLYNFGSDKARGNLTVKAPEGWKAKLPTDVEVSPGERKELEMELESNGNKTATEADIRVMGDFARAGQPLLALRVVVE